MKKPHNPLDGEAPIMTFNVQQDATDDQISIIIVHKDQPGYLNILLQSITVTSLNSRYEIIIVDNGSTKKDSIDFLDAMEESGECRIIRNKENLWWSKAANQGAKAADKASSFFFFAHSDVVVVNPGWMDILMNVSRGEKSGLVGLQMHGIEMDNERYDFIVEWGMLVTRDCWQDCGPFPEELPLLGTSFIFTRACQLAKQNPQIVKSPVCLYHYAAGEFNPSEYERMGLEAKITLPRLMQKIQKKYGI